MAALDNQFIQLGGAGSVSLFAWALFRKTMEVSKLTLRISSDVQAKEIEELRRHNAELLRIQKDAREDEIGRLLAEIEKMKAELASIHKTSAVKPPHQEDTP